MDSKFFATVEWIFVLIFAGGSVGGLAALLRSNKDLTPRNVFGATLNSGMIALVIAMVWWKKHQSTDNIYFLVGVSILAGLGGATTWDFARVYLSKRFGIQLTENETDEKNEDK